MWLNVVAGVRWGKDRVAMVGILPSSLEAFSRATIKLKFVLEQLTVSLMIEDMEVERGINLHSIKQDLLKALFYIPPPKSHLCICSCLLHIKFKKCFQYPDCSSLPFCPFSLFLLQYSLFISFLMQMVLVSFITITAYYFSGTMLNISHILLNPCSNFIIPVFT